MRKVLLLFYVIFNLSVTTNEGEIIAQEKYTQEDIDAQMDKFRQSEIPKAGLKAEYRQIGKILSLLGLAIYGLAILNKLVIEKDPKAKSMLIYFGVGIMFYIIVFQKLWV